MVPPVCETSNDPMSLDAYKCWFLNLIGYREMPYTTCEDEDNIGKNFIGNCGFDFAGKALEHLLPNLEDSNID